MIYDVTANEKDREIRLILSKAKATIFIKKIMPKNSLTRLPSVNEDYCISFEVKSSQSKCCVTSKMFAGFRL